MNPIKDISAELTKLRDDPATLRKFSFTIAAALLVLGVAIFYFSALDNALWLWGMASVLTICGLARPALLKPFHKIWMTLGLTLGWFMSRLILTLLFYLVMTPIGLVLRASGKDILNQRIDKNAPTYWTRRTGKERTPETYKKLF